MLCLIHDSGRGVRYAADDYRKTLAAAGMTPSMSRKGNCLDNAPMESFFRSLTHCRPARAGRRPDLLLLQPACAVHDSPDMNENAKRPVLRIRIVFGKQEMIGPGKAELLELVDRCGSIAAAGREMGMSYKRAWQLIGTLNAMFLEPLVDSTRGGPGGGGAVLTDAGRNVLSLYRAFEADAAEAGAARLESMRALLRDIPEEK
jgi:molybdate transport system regulatory protein